jgi:hypothetical protein
LNQSSSGEPLVNNLNLKDGNTIIKNTNQLFDSLFPKNPTQINKNTSYNSNLTNLSKNAMVNNLILPKNNQNNIIKTLKSFHNKKMNNLDTIKTKINYKYIANNSTNTVSTNAHSNKIENVIFLFISLYFL